MARKCEQDFVVNLPPIDASGDMTGDGFLGKRSGDTIHRRFLCEGFVRFHKELPNG